MTDSPTNTDLNGNFRRHVYAVLIVLTAGVCAGRILSTQLVLEPSLHAPHGPRAWPAAVPKPMPTFSSNDRSRWATVRALVEKGTYAIGRRDPRDVTEKNKFGDTGFIFEDGYGSVDKVLDPDTQQFYSSKPPFLATLAAGEYWLLNCLFGWTLAEQPFEVVRTVLFTFNWLPLIVYLWVLSRLVERRGTSDWGRLFVMAAACFGTFLTTFVTTLNNHLLAACAVAFALHPLMRIWLDGKDEWWRFAFAGFFGALAACSELPGAVFGVALFALLVVRDPVRTLCVFVPAALLPIGAFLLTNYLAVGSAVPVQMKFGTEWYLYEGSHWLNIQRNPTGIDAAAEPKHVYAFHLFFGHHGFFALTPVFILSVVGIVRALRNSGSANRMLAGLCAAISALVFAFYIFQTSNYGGWTAGPRWLFWLTPLWLLAMVPALERLAVSRLGRAIAYLLLALSALSAAYPAWNPWRHPWLYNLLEHLGWIGY